MNNYKWIEIRDNGTFVPAICFKITESGFGEGWLMQRVGFDWKNPGILLVDICINECHYEPHAWPGYRPMRIVHDWLYSHFDEVQGGDVVDVRYILGETDEPAKSDRCNDD